MSGGLQQLFNGWVCARENEMTRQKERERERERFMAFQDRLV